MNCKALHRGRVEGTLAAARAEGRPLAAAVQALAAQLRGAVAAAEPTERDLQDA